MLKLWLLLLLGTSVRIRGELFETERGIGDVEVGGEGGGMLYFLADFKDTLWLFYL